DTAYAGTVTPTTTPDGVITPSNHTYSAGDAGVFTFSVTWPTTGTKTINATDHQAHTAPAQTVIVGTSSAASITVTPSNPSAGQSISVSGTGFNPNTTVNITSNGDYSSATVQPANNTTGSWGPVTLTDITPTASGQSTITATDTGTPSRSASQTITVSGTGTCTGATLTISPTTAARGPQVPL